MAVIDNAYRKNKNGEEEILYPISKEKAIYDENNIRLDNKLKALEAKIGTGGGSNSEAFITVKSFGAAGDGVTDDTQAFKDAIKSAEDTGSALYLNQGTYLITDRLQVTKPLHILGGGLAQTVLMFTPTVEKPELSMNSVEWYPESDAAIIVKSNHVIMEHFSIKAAENLENAIDWNGIIMHWHNGTSLNVTQRNQLNNIRIQGFRNGLLLYGGWNRYITCCEFQSCSDSAVKYVSLDSGDWSGSGDVILACQMLNSNNGLYAEHLFQSTIWECVFEYNQHALVLDTCHDVTIKNCWNEENFGNILVTGSCRFEGGYSINHNTVTHTPLSAESICSFVTENNSYIYYGEQLVFSQINGVITKGVDLTAEIDNMIGNASFVDMTGWNLYESYIFSIDTAKKLNGLNSVKCSSSGQTEDQYWNCTSNKIPVSPQTKYTYTLQAYTEDASTIDNGIYLRVEFFYGNAEKISDVRQEILFVGNNSWENKTMEFTTQADCAYVTVGFTIDKNGTYWVNKPTLYANDTLVRNNVYFKKEEGNSVVKVLDNAVNEIGSIDLNLTLTKNDDNTVSATYDIDGTETSLLFDNASKLGGQSSDYYATKAELTNSLSGKASSTHTHTAAQVGAAAASHTHDDRYYTESEVNNLLNNKANASHTHDDRYYTESEIDAKITTVNNSINAKASVANPTFTGTAKTTANTSYTTAQLRNIYFTTATPTSLENGAVCFVYE